MFSDIKPVAKNNKMWGKGYNFDKVGPAAMFVHHKFSTEWVKIELQPLRYEVIVVATTLLWVMHIKSSFECLIDNIFRNSREITG
jgi:hypothetical protein